VVANTVSVTEERKTEETHETPQSAVKDSVTLTAEDTQPRAVSDMMGGLENVTTVSAGNEEFVPTTPAAKAIDEGTTAPPTSPETPPTQSTAGSAKDKKGLYSDDILCAFLRLNSTQLLT